MLYKVDLHTHSSASPDGSLQSADYRSMLERHQLDAIAITDHNTTDVARRLHAELGDAIIIGEEITTTAGEIIGLYLTATIPPMLTVVETVKRIRAQGGVVYVPHPFETIRKGLTADVLETIAGDIDIIETHNGRAVFQNRSKTAIRWAERHHVAGAASSDAHGKSGWGRTYSMLSSMPSSQTLSALLVTAQYEVGFPGLTAMAYPKVNRLRKQNWGITR